MLKLFGYNLEQIAEYISYNNYKIAIYGAGMIGRTIMPDYLMRHGLDENLIAAHTDTVFPIDTDVTVKKEGNRYYCPGINDDTHAAAEIMAVAKTKNTIAESASTGSPFSRISTFTKSE